MHHMLLCFVEIKAGVKAYNANAAIDKISLCILVNLHKNKSTTFLYRLQVFGAHFYYACAETAVRLLPV